MTHKCVTCILAIVILNALPIYCQYSASQKIEINTNSAEQRETVSASMSAADLEKHADELRAIKEYFEAADYYHAALAKKPDDPILYNKLGIDELMSQRLEQAHKDFERSLKLDSHYAEAYNNLGVLEYVRRRYGKAVKQYEKAITNGPNDASYYSNLGTAYFSKKDWKKSTKAYTEAVHLDPDVFERVSDVGVAGQISSPEDQAHFSYVLAKLYAKNGWNDRSLECLRRAMEDGYKEMDAVYTDAEFAGLRKDPRFAKLMASRPMSIPD